MGEVASIAANLLRCEYEMRTDEGEFPPFARTLAIGNRQIETPQDYFEFLTLFPVSGDFRQLVNCRGLESCEWSDDGLYSINTLLARSHFSVRDLISSNVQDRNISEYLLIIGNDSFGNLFCMSTNQDTFGQIYFVDHEAPLLRSSPLVARSFSDFLNSLEVDL